jgi:hypothetical protein
MDKKFVIGTFVTVALAFIGYVVKYYSDSDLAVRKDKLERINRQLKDLYGPLYGMGSADDAVWKAFMKKYAPNKKNFFDPPVTSYDEEVWRNWMMNVYQPLNERMVNTITNNTDLMVENCFPQTFKDLCAHEESYKAVIARWKNHDFTSSTALLDYNANAFMRYITNAYDSLKKEQNSLLKSMK